MLEVLQISSSASSFIKITLSDLDRFITGTESGTANVKKKHIVQYNTLVGLRQTIVSIALNSSMLIFLNSFPPKSTIRSFEQQLLCNGVNVCGIDLYLLHFHHALLHLSIYPQDYANLPESVWIYLAIIYIFWQLRIMCKLKI